MCIDYFITILFEANMKQLEFMTVAAIKQMTAYLSIYLNVIIISAVPLSRWSQESEQNALCVF